MKLVFKKVQKSITEERKAKLLSLGDKNKEIDIGFNWTLTPENKEEDDERMKNFHLFCTSIVLDLLKEEFKTNEKGAFKYKKYKKNKLVIQKLNNLFSIIANNE